MRGTLASWNGIGEQAQDEPLRGAFLVAHDALGGFFALDTGGLSKGTDGVYYLGPDTLTWDDTGMSYSGLVQFAASGDLGGFYENLRWPGWEEESRQLTGDQGISVYPFLSSRGGPLKERNRAAIPMLELWRLHLLLPSKTRRPVAGRAVHDLGRSSSARQRAQLGLLKIQRG